MIALPIWSLVLIIALLILISGFFSGSEIALFSFRRTRLAMLVKQGNKNALLVNKVMQRPESLLSTILVGNNIVNIVASVLATVLAIELFQEEGVIFAMVGMAFLTIQFGEIIPKSLASQFWEKASFAAVRPIRFLTIIFYPFVVFFSLMTHLLAWVLGIRIHYRKPLITKEELRHTVDMVKEAGHLKEDETLIIQNIFKFTDRRVQEVMLPRGETDLLNLDAPNEDVQKIITDKHHTRIPVYQNKPDNIIGVLYTKEYLNMVCYGDGGLIVLHDLLRKPYVVSNTWKISAVLRELQKNRVHLAIVKDKADKFVGIITIEDILEEIVGEIWDEHDVTSIS